MTAQMSHSGLTAAQRATLHCPEWCATEHTDIIELDPRDMTGVWITHDSEPVDFGPDDQNTVPICQTSSNLLAARLLGVTPDTVAKMVRRGELRSHRCKPSLSRRQVEHLAEQRRRYRMRPSEAARHLGLDVSTLRRWLAVGMIPGRRTVGGLWRLDPEDVWRIRTEGVDLITRREAAGILGVSPGRVTQLVDADLIPCVEVPTPNRRRRMYRRAQLEVVANARDARWARWH